MFRSKQKLREQLRFEKERNIALTNALLTEKDRTKRYRDLFTNMKTAHQELRNKYENLQMKMLSRSVPKFKKKGVTHEHSGPTKREEDFYFRGGE